MSLVLGIEDLQFRCQTFGVIKCVGIIRGTFQFTHFGAKTSERGTHNVSSLMISESSCIGLWHCQQVTVDITYRSKHMVK